MEKEPRDNFHPDDFQSKKSSSPFYWLLVIGLASIWFFGVWQFAIELKDDQNYQEEIIELKKEKLKLEIQLKELQLEIETK